MPHEKRMNLYSSTMQMVKDILKRYLPCQVVSLDLKHFSVIFHFPAVSRAEYGKMTEALSNASAMVHNYFNVRLLAGIGSVADSPLKYAIPIRMPGLPLPPPLPNSLSGTITR